MKNVKSDTIIRTIILLLALTNQMLTAFGFSALPILDEHIEVLVSTGFTVAAAVWAWWKNNSFTKAAIAADEAMEKMKEEQK